MAGRHGLPHVFYHVQRPGESVLLKNFVNRQDAVGPIVILDQNSDIGNTAQSRSGDLPEGTQPDR